MKIDAYYDEKGTTCEHCGTFIKHVYVVTDNGVTMKIGSTCIRKVSNISDYGIKVLNKMRSNLESAINMMNLFMSDDLKAIKDKYYYGGNGMTEYLDIDSETFKYRERTNEEFLTYLEGKRKVLPMTVERMKNELNKKFASAKLKKGVVVK